MTDLPEVLELRISRVLPAPVRKVWEVYTTPDHIRGWFSIFEPDSFAQIAIDFRVGGQMVAKWGPDADHLFWETQTFLEIQPDTRIVTESVGGDPSGTTMTVRTEIAFEPAEEDATLVSVQQHGFPTPELRDFFLQVVWNGAFDRIAAYLAQFA